MKFHLARQLVPDSMEMRSAYCETMIRLAEKHSNLVVLDADLLSAMGMMPFKKCFPDRTIDLGIMEANMIGVASGMAIAGALPFAHSFATFVTRRAFDQMFLSGGYAGADIKVIGSDPGITAALNGGTHMAFEDMGLMMAIPGTTVIEPADVSMLMDMLPQIAVRKGIQYMRLVRKSCTQIYERNSQFCVGKGNVLFDGSEQDCLDATIIASGYCVAEALKIVPFLKEKDIRVRIIDMHTWKPIDKALIIESAQRSRVLITAENHRVSNGLGAEVAKVLVQTVPRPMTMVGVGSDRFGEVGSVDYLAHAFGLTAEHILETVLKALRQQSTL